jgi:hypothetical protein
MIRIACFQINRFISLFLKLSIHLTKIIYKTTNQLMINAQTKEDRIK